MARSSAMPQIAAELSVRERVMLFCIASDTDWAKAGIVQPNGSSTS
jgi:hypothetical protein